MAKIVFEERYGVFWVPSVSDLSAPTVAEIEAGTELTFHVPKDGVNPGATNNKVDSGSIGSRMNKQISGSYGYDLSLTFFKDDEDDVAWDLFPRDTQGYIVVCPTTQEPGAGDTVYIWEVTSQEATLPASAADTQQRFTVEFAVQDADMRAVVAASSS